MGTREGLGDNSSYLAKLQILDIGDPGRPPSTCDYGSKFFHPPHRSRGPSTWTTPTLTTQSVRLYTRDRCLHRDVSRSGTLTIRAKHWSTSALMHGHEPSRRMCPKSKKVVQYLRGGAAWSCDLDGLGAPVVAGLDVELHLLALSKAAEAVGDDARLRRQNIGNQDRQATRALPCNTCKTSTPLPDRQRPQNSSNSVT